MERRGSVRLLNAARCALRCLYAYRGANSEGNRRGPCEGCRDSCGSVTFLADLWRKRGVRGEPIMEAGLRDEPSTSSRRNPHVPGSRGGHSLPGPLRDARDATRTGGAGREADPTPGREALDPASVAGDEDGLGAVDGADLAVDVVQVG